MLPKRFRFCEKIFIANISTALLDAILETKSALVFQNDIQ